MFLVISDELGYHNFLVLQQLQLYSLHSLVGVIWPSAIVKSDVHGDGLTMLEGILEQFDFAFFVVEFIH